MDEAELNLLYMRLFKEQIINDWDELAGEMNFGEATDEDVVNALQQKRYAVKWVIK